MADNIVIPFVVSLVALVLLALSTGGFGADSRPGVSDDHQRVHPE